jgi:hypothetical protein
VIIVTKEDLPQTPVAFQVYAQRYLREINVGGTVFLANVVAPSMMSVSGGGPHSAALNPSSCGCPAGSMPGDIELADWIRRESEKPDGLVRYLSGEWYNKYESAGE